MHKNMEHMRIENNNQKEIYSLQKQVSYLLASVEKLKTEMAFINKKTGSDLEPLYFRDVEKELSEKNSVLTRELLYLIRNEDGLNDDTK